RDLHPHPEDATCAGGTCRHAVRSRAPSHRPLVMKARPTVLPRTRRPYLLRLIGVLAVAALVATALGTSGKSATLSSSAVPTTNLSDVCPSTIVLQTDWFPEMEYGAYFSLIGAKGKLDAKKGTYTGPLGKTGVDLQIRAGGPFLGQQTVQSIMYQD